MCIMRSRGAHVALIREAVYMRSERSIALMIVFMCVLLQAACSDESGKSGAIENLPPLIVHHLRKLHGKLKNLMRLG